MASRKTREIITGLIKKGFQRRDGNHVYLHYYDVTGKKTKICTKVSHGSKEYGNKILSLMAYQIGLSLEDFLNLIDCPMTQEEYEKKKNR